MTRSKGPIRPDGGRRGRSMNPKRNAGPGGHGSADGRAGPFGGRGRPGSIWGVLRALGWRGGLEDVSAGVLTLAAQRGVPVDTLLGPLLEDDPPARGTSERRRLLAEALKRVLWRAASEGRLDDLRAIVFRRRRSRPECDDSGDRGGGKPRGSGRRS